MLNLELLKKNNMTKNNIKIKKKKKVKKRFSMRENSAGKTIHSILDGSILTKENVIQFLPFILFLSLLALIYIANNYYSEKIIIEKGEIKSELKELRYEHISKKFLLMDKSKQSEVAKKLEPKQIKESLVPPKKIIIYDKKQD